MGFCGQLDIYLGNKFSVCIEKIVIYSGFHFLVKKNA